MSASGRFFLKVMLALLVIGSLAPFTVIKGTDGQPLMSWKEVVGGWPPSWYKDAKRASKKAIASVGSSSDDTGSSGGLSDLRYYIWADNKGKLVFSGMPPRDGRPYESATHAEVSVIRSMSEKDIAVALAEATVTEPGSRDPLVIGRSADGKNTDAAGDAELQQTVDKVEQMMQGGEDGGFSLTSISPADIPMLIKAAQQARQKMETPRANGI